VAFAPRPLSEPPYTLARINAGISYSAQRGTTVRPPFLEGVLYIAALNPRGSQKTKTAQLLMEAAIVMRDR
jgi:hypothetical protein